MMLSVLQKTLFMITKDVHLFIQNTSFFSKANGHEYVY